MFWREQLLHRSAGTHARHVVEESPTRFKQPTDSPAFTRPGFNLEVDDLLIPASGLIITPSTEPSTHRSEHSRHIDDLADTCRCRTDAQSSELSVD
ncbi:hypothetical protein DTO063F5_1300 [Paecilomyces variotii]|nr:hypothetical protein DTO063F5_1300 [Paecilomyces variotii]